MELGQPPLVVAFELTEHRKAIVADALAGTSAVVYLTELDEAARTEALRNTGVLLTFNTSKELRPGEARLLEGARLIQAWTLFRWASSRRGCQWQPTAAAMPSRWLSMRSRWHLPPPSA
jgi:hypothetical protein